MVHRTVVIITLASAAGTSSASCSPPQAGPGSIEQRVAALDRQLERLRVESNIPAISVALVQNERIVFAKGYGIADLSTGRPATDTTTYHFASLTKPFAAGILLQLVQEGRISLDDPMSKYGVDLPGPGVIRVRHLLSHTSSGTPGTVYRYDGNRFSLLDSVIVRTTSATFAAELQRRLLQPLRLTRATPNPDHAAFAVTGIDRGLYLSNLARGYSYANGQHTPIAYPRSFSSAAGMTGSVGDLAAFSIALDRGTVLEPATRQLAFSPVVTEAGDTLPYGLGWFSTRHRGEQIVWHYGHWIGNSSLIIKVPARRLTFIVLANTDALSARYALGAGRLESSPWAQAFFSMFGG